jgi:hypothetical protein
MERFNADGTRYYTQRQSLHRAFIAGFCRAFGIQYPRDWRQADYSSSWTRIEDAIAHAELETLD